MLYAYWNPFRTQEKSRFSLTIWTVAYVVDKLLETYRCQFFFLNILELKAFTSTTVSGGSYTLTPSGKYFHF
jgi:hypothetical protein